MKISCLPVSFFREITSGAMSVEEWARLGAAAGLDGIDLSVILLKNHTPAGLREIKKGIASGGLPVVMVTTYPDFCHPDPIQRKRELEYLRHDIAIASEIGAAYLRIVAGQAHPGLNEDAAIGWVLDGFAPAAATAETFGIQLVYENHSKPAAWLYPDFSHPTSIFLKIAAALKDTSIRINFDTANTLAYGDDPLPVLSRVIGQVATIHAADTASRGSLQPVPVGTGLAPLPEIFALLKTHGFDGWISIEEASFTGRSAIRKAADLIRRTWSKA